LGGWGGYELLSIETGNELKMCRFPELNARIFIFISFNYYKNNSSFPPLKSCRYLDIKPIWAFWLQPIQFLSQFAFRINACTSYMANSIAYPVGRPALKNWIISLGK